jgi:hypothetical protein
MINEFVLIFTIVMNSGEAFNSPAYVYKDIDSCLNKKHELTSGMNLKAPVIKSKPHIVFFSAVCSPAIKKD